MGRPREYRNATGRYALVPEAVGARLPPVSAAVFMMPPLRLATPPLIVMPAEELVMVVRPVAVKLPPFTVSPVPAVEVRPKAPATLKLAPVSMPRMPPETVPLPE